MAISITTDWATSSTDTLIPRSAVSFYDNTTVYLCYAASAQNVNLTIPSLITYGALSWTTISTRTVVGIGIMVWSARVATAPTAATLVIDHSSSNNTIQSWGMQVIHASGVSTTNASEWSAKNASSSASSLGLTAAAYSITSSRAMVWVMHDQNTTPYTQPSGWTSTGSASVTLQTLAFYGGIADQPSSVQTFSGIPGANNQMGILWAATGDNATSDTHTRVGNKALHREPTRSILLG